MSSDCRKYPQQFIWCAALIVGLTACGTLIAQQLPTSVPGQSAGPSAASFQGSVATGQVTPQTIELSLDDAIQRGVKSNLGAILSGTQTAAAKAQRLSQLQPLLPDVEFNAREAEMQVDLAAQGLRIPGIPTIIGPFGYTDLRASLSWSLLDLKALRTYMAAKHQFNAARLSEQDARDMVVLTVGNAYMLVLADQGRVESFQAQVATSKVSLDQANANHEAGTAPKLDVLRAQVDYQSLQQQLIVAQNSL
jgi:outer membrane protein TolC